MKEIAARSVYIGIGPDLVHKGGNMNALFNLRARPVSAKPLEGRKIVRDPVCGMDLESWDIRYVEVVDGKTYQFCSLACKQTFLLFPNKF